ncbi:MAG: hypothetical protein ABIP51_16515 [Bacteroidia bacterium]
MNFTLSTILIIFFLIPGFIFRRAYYSQPFPRKYSKFSLFGEISWIIIPSVILQILGIYLIYWIWYENFLELKRFYDFILDCYKPDQNFKIEVNYHVLIIYTGILWLISITAGYLINLVIRRTHLDKRFKIFSFDNEWYYYLSSEILDFPNIEGTSSEVGLTFVDVLTKTGEETVLYSGILQKFDLKEDGGLATICLTNVQRKGFANSKINEIKTNDSTKEYFQYKDVPSTFLVIPFENILNLNVRFFKVNIKPYTESKEIVEKQDNLPLKDQDKKATFTISTGEAIILGLTLLMLIVIVISLFSKPDKTIEERDEDKSTSAVSLLLLIAILVGHFYFKVAWMPIILYSLSGALFLMAIIQIATSRKNR